MPKEVENVFSALERVFAGEIVYDEALMELGLHTAQVRKQWPALFKALSGREYSLAALQDNAKMQLLPTGTTIVAQPAPASTTLNIQRYSRWATGPIHNMALDEETLVEWDKSGVPMPNVSETLTLRGGTRRTRFTVVGTEGENIMRVRIVAILPMAS